MTAGSAIPPGGDSRPPQSERGRSDGDGEQTPRLPSPLEPVAEPQSARDGQAAAGKSASGKSASGKSASGGPRVLVVDDSTAAATTLSMLLVCWGYETRTACDGLEALDVAAAFRPDVVLLDIGMPKLNGYDTARRMREQPWGAAVVLVALTGWSQGESQRRSREAGFDHHLVKPAEPAVLRALLAGLRKPNGCRRSASQG